MVMLFAISLVNKPFFISTILARERERQNGQLIPAIFKFQSPKCIFLDRNDTETKQKPLKGGKIRVT